MGEEIMSILSYIGLIVSAMIVIGVFGYIIAKVIHSINLDDLYDAEQAKRDVERMLAEANSEVDRLRKSGAL
jgi:hypothetical protein